MSTKSENEGKVEKFLKISDFVTYIIDKMDIFLETKLEGVQTTDETEQVASEYLNHFLLNIQDSIDFDKTVSALIENRVHQMILDELFE